MEPIIDLTSQSIKVLSATGGFLGGTSMLAYARPVDAFDAIKRVAVSTVAALMLSSVISMRFIGDESSEAIMGASFAIGFVSWSVLGAIAKFFEGRKDADILEMVKSLGFEKKDESNE